MADNLNDEMKRATANDNLNDGLRAWYLAHDATGGTLGDLERQYLEAQKAAAGG